MIPTDLVLKSVPLVGYNNNILIASKNMKIGQNDSLNTESIPLVDTPKSEPPVLEPVENQNQKIISPMYLSVGISLVLLAAFYVYKA